MKEDFVPYNIAVKLRKKGFNIDTDFCYNQDGGIVRVGTCPAPQIHEVLKRLREKHATHIEISLGRNGWYFEIIQYEYYEEEKEYDCKLITVSVINDSYEETTIAGIEYVIDNLI